jgi:hypothetical protein
LGAFEIGSGKRSAGRLMIDFWILFQDSLASRLGERERLIIKSEKWFQNVQDKSPRGKESGGRMNGDFWTRFRNTQGKEERGKTESGGRP